MIPVTKPFLPPKKDYKKIVDEIYVFNGQSGLCWALASNADTFLINKKYQYCNVEELTASKHKININNVSNVTLLKKKFIKGKGSLKKIDNFKNIYTNDLIKKNKIKKNKMKKTR